MHNNYSFSTSLRLYRVANDLSQDDLARIVGVSRKTINAIENTGTRPSIVLALRLAQTLEATVDDLFRLETTDSEN